MSTPNLSGWWKLIFGFLVGIIVPSLIAWGALIAKVDDNARDIEERLRITTFVEYKEGTAKRLDEIQNSLNRIEDKIGNRSQQ